MQISKDGGATFTTLTTISGGTTGSTIALSSQDLSAYISENMVVRLSVNAGFNQVADKFYLDNVQIAAQGNNYATTFTEKGPAIQLMDANATLTIPSGAVTAATVTITNMKAGDVLGYTTTNGITGAWSTDGSILTLSGSGKTTAQFLAALKAVTFSNDSGNPDATTRAITLTATDGLRQAPP